MCPLFAVEPDRKWNNYFKVVYYLLLVKNSIYLFVHLSIATHLSLKRDWIKFLFKKNWQGCKYQLNNIHHYYLRLIIHGVLITAWHLTITAEINEHVGIMAFPEIQNVLLLKYCKLYNIGNRIICRMLTRNT